MNIKRIPYVVGLVIIIIVVLFAVHFFYKRNARQLSGTSEIFINLINENKSFASLLIPVKKIVLNAPDTLLLDNDLYMMTAFCDSTLIIVNRDAKQILLVNKEGKIIKLMGRQGSGPGEFMNITCFALSPNKLIYIYDYLQQRFTVIDFNGSVQNIIKLKTPGIQVRHISITKNGMILIHHPPSNEYPAFISEINSNGDFIKNLQTDVNWKYTYFYQRGFLDGDLMLTRNNKIIEANDFSYHIFIGDLSNKFIAAISKPDHYNDPPSITHDSPNEYIQSVSKMTIPLFILSYRDSIFFQLYTSSSDRQAGSNSVLRLFDISGNYLGNMPLNMPILPNLGDPSYLIGIDPKIENGHLNQRIPYNFTIYKWKSLSELEGKSWNGVNSDTLKTIFDIQKIGLFKNVDIIGFISQEDCETCDEILISALKQLNLKLKNRNKGVSLVIVNSDLSFLQDLKLRYGNLLNIYRINNPVNFHSPSLFISKYGKYKEIEIHPNHTDILKFMSQVDSLQSAIN